MKYRAFRSGDEISLHASVQMAVIFEDHVPVYSGLVDQSGVPLYRLPENCQPGFVIPTTKGTII